MVTTPVGLTKFFVAYPEIYAENPWASVPGWQAPIITPQAVVTEALGRGQSVGTDGFVKAGIPRTGVATGGSGGHQGLLQFAVTALTEEGRPERVVDQTGATIPDGIVAPERNLFAYTDQLNDLATLQNLEVEDKNLSKPARISVNQGRALHQGPEVLFVAESKGDATSIYKFLQQPIQDIHKEGAHRYKTTKTAKFEGGAVPLLPQIVDEAVWELTTDREQRLYANGAVVATGDAPRLIDAGSEYRVERSDGSTHTTAIEKIDNVED